MKLYRQKFKYWDDEHTQLIRKFKAKEFLDPDYYIQAHFHPPESKTPYFLNKRCRKLFDKHGPFNGRYKDGDELVDKSLGEDCFIFCPGPSMSDADLKKFDGRLTMAVNSAAFSVDATYWVMAESAYARWLLQESASNALEIPEKRNVISTARVAVCFRNEEILRKKILFGSIYICRWEESYVVPPRVPAVSVFNALVSAWEMGCKRVFLIGLDLSKDGGPYVKGVPYTKEGAENPFDDQIRALSQFEMPDFKVYNGSPASKDVLPFEYVPYGKMLNE